MKRTDLIFAGLQVPLDYVTIVAAGLGAYAIRFDSLNVWLPIVNPIPYGDYVRTVLVMAVVWVAILAIAGVYNVRQQRLSFELGRIFLGLSTAVLLIIVFIFFRREFFTSRFIILAGWGLSIVFVWAIHALARLVRWYLLKRGVGIKQIVVIGSDRNSVELLNRFHQQSSLGIKVYKHFPSITADTISELETIMPQRLIDAVIQTDPDIPRSQTMEIIDHCTEYNIPFQYAADVFETQAARLEMDYIGGIPVMALKRTPLDGWGRILKRAFDLGGALVGLIICFIPGLLVALIIKLDSAGSIFVRLERVGEGQKRFRLWKFRSMIRDAHALKSQLLDQNERTDGPLFKIKNDPRITRVGRWLRKSSIDELPQLINVLTGEMSLVGPRPHEPEEVARYDRHHKKLLTIKPGMTGMAQISGRSNLSFEDEVRLDTYYIEHWSLNFDLQILFRTPLAVMQMKTAV